MDPKQFIHKIYDNDDEYKLWPKEMPKHTISDAKRTTLFKPPAPDEEWIVGGCPGVEAGPVIEVTSVTISNQTNGSLTEDFEIYGQISITGNTNVTITGNDKNTYYVYKRGFDDAQHLSPTHNHLSLCHCPIAPLTMGKLQFTLTNKNTGLPIFEGEVHVVDYSFTADCNGEEECFTVRGKHGYDATVVYSVVPLTVIADVGMSVTRPPNLGTVTVEGAVTMNGVSILANKSFQIPKEKSLHDVELSRTAVGIPVYYWVVFEFSLKLDGTDFATGRLVYDPRSRWTVERKACNVEGYSITMRAEYECPDEFYVRENEVHRTLVHRTLKDVISSDDYVEVYSVIVDGCVLCPVHSTIIVRDRDLAANIFSGNEITRNEEDTTRIVLSLTWPDNWWLVPKDSCMNLNIVDPKGNHLCRGGFNFCNTDSVMYPLRYDRRMSVVLTGDGGYFAAVHYSVFRNGKKTKLTFEWNGQYNIVVYGSVFAEYSNMDYHSTYEEEYYRNIIFRRSRKEFVKVKSNSSIPLSKSWVTTPSDCEGLFVYVDLEVMGYNVAFPGNSIDNPVNKLWLDFDSSDPCPPMWVYDPSRNIRLGSIVVKVDWSSVRE